MAAKLFRLGQMAVTIEVGEGRPLTEILDEYGISEVVRVNSVLVEDPEGRMIYDGDKIVAAPAQKNG